MTLALTPVPELSMAWPIWVYGVLLAFLAIHVPLQVVWAAVVQRAAAGPVSVVPDKILPSVAVLVAARNEGHQLAETLRSLQQLDYPREKLTIWVGDDASTDDTAAVAERFVKLDRRFRLIRLPDGVGGGKQRVLAQLFEQAEAAFYAITDADVEVPPTWVKTLLTAFSDEQVGIASGPTTLKGAGAWAGLQRLDWLFGFGMIQVFKRLGGDLTGAGNNMLVRHHAYWQTGGYSQLAFNLTEDYALMAAIKRANWRVAWVHHIGARNTTKALPSLQAYLHQRKRWFKGGVGGPWFGISYFSWQAFGGLWAVATLLLFPPVWAAAAMLLKLLADALLAARAVWAFHQKAPVGLLLLHSLYFQAAMLLLPLYFLVPGKVRWKGRAY